MKAVLLLTVSVQAGAPSHTGAASCRTARTCQPDTCEDAKTVVRQLLSKTVSAQHWRDAHTPRGARTRWVWNR